MNKQHFISCTDLERIKLDIWKFYMQLSQLLTFDLPRQIFCFYCDMYVAIEAAWHLLVVTFEDELCCKSDLTSLRAFSSLKNIFAAFA